jgi:hypothetical protein
MAKDPEHSGSGYRLPGWPFAFVRLNVIAGRVLPCLRQNRTHRAVPAPSANRDEDRNRFRAERNLPVAGEPGKPGGVVAKFFGKVSQAVAH